MSTMLNSEAYRKLLDEDVMWLKQQRRTLERDHIEAILQSHRSDAMLYIHAREVIDIVMRLVEWDGMGDAPEVLHEIVEDAKRIMTEVK